jgi:hypothetical protein
VELWVRIGVSKAKCDVPQQLSSTWAVDFVADLAFGQERAFELHPQVFCGDVVVGCDGDS